MMTEESVHHLEREVEAARAKLASDLTVLRSPHTTADFTRALKHEANATVASIIEDVKGRAAANPAAALAIGAGLAWRLVRHPPIATALIGAGIFSLFRSAPAHASNGAGYLTQATTRLQEQASQAVDFAAEQTAQAASRATEKTAELASAAKERVREWTAEAASSSKQAASELQQRAVSMSREAADRAASMSQDASEVVSEISERARVAARPYAQSAQQIINDSEARDKLLLGGAGIAVLAALTIALQRRMQEAKAQH
jgi:hypothetical protein